VSWAGLGPVTVRLRPLFPFSIFFLFNKQRGKNKYLGNQIILEKCVAWPKIFFAIYDTATIILEASVIHLHFS
jgi:hypothetical protein